jgi:adenylate cyclase, class 2
MPRETEIKIRIDDEKGLRRALKKLGAKAVYPGAGRVHEWNVIFDTPQGGLAKQGQLLRIRKETLEGGSKRGKGSENLRIVLTFKAPVAEIPQTRHGPPSDRRHKVREEIEVEVTDAQALTKILEGLGLRGWFCYEKYRTTFRLPRSRPWAKDLLIELDETPVGTFLELEAPPEAIDRAAQELGFSKRDYVLKNYLTLYIEDCRRRGLQPRDMLFVKKD